MEKKKEFVEPELVKHEERLDEVTMLQSVGSPITTIVGPGTGPVPIFN